MTPLIGIVMGSDSDYRVMIQAVEIVSEFGISFETKVVSAHRTPHKMLEYGHSAQARGLKIIIAGAGGAAHLPGMLASVTTLPVIGVPIALKKLEGIDSLLSMVQMPAGVPVATVAIDNAKNAGLLAIRILSLYDDQLESKVSAYQAQLEIESSAKVVPPGEPRSK